jgi:hypothetical protein
MPKRDVAGREPRAGRRSVKYEKSSVLLCMPPRSAQSILATKDSGRGDIHMRAIAQCHERKQRPLVINRRISSLLRSKPALYLRASINPSAAFLAPRCQTRGSSPSMMEAHHGHQRHKPIATAIAWHSLHLCRNSSRHLGFLVSMLHCEYRYAIQFQPDTTQSRLQMRSSYRLLNPRE